MDREAAVAALEALPEVARIEVARLKPTDVIVVQCHGSIDDNAANAISAQIKRVFPKNEVVVLDSGLALKIVEGND